MSLLEGHNNFVFAGRDSLDWDIWPNGYRTFNGTTRDVEEFVVPGRHGSLVKDNGRFENVEVLYEDCGIVGPDAMERFKDFRNFVQANADGYYRLEDSYHPEAFRLARFVGPLEPDIGAAYDTVLFDLLFDCKPELFLKSGEEWLEDPAELYNQTLQTAKPIIRIYGTGTLTVGSATVTIASHSYSYIDLDCDLGDAYYNSNNANSKVTMTDVPILKPGKTTISGTVTGWDIMPRWWTT